MSENSSGLSGMITMLKRDIGNEFESINKDNLFNKIILLFHQKRIDGLRNILSEKVSDNRSNLNKDDELFKLMNEQLSELSKAKDDIEFSGEDDMTPDKALAIGAKIAIVGGTLLVIGIAVALIVAKQKKKYTEEPAKNQKSDTPQKPDGGLLNILQKERSFPFSKNDNPPAPDYQLHHLLLIIPANQAAILKNTEQLTIEQVKKLIAHSPRAYCFKEGNEEGQNIAVKVECSEEFDDTTESRVFVHLKLDAESSIITQRIRLNISDKIKPDTEINVVKYGKLKSARFTRDYFYDI